MMALKLSFALSLISTVCATADEDKNKLAAVAKRTRLIPTVE